MPTVDIDFLRNLSFLKGASPDVLSSLAQVALQRDFQASEIIMWEGSTGRQLYVIIHGLVEVVKGAAPNEMRLAQRGPGEFIGEMALLEDRPRFATIRALQPTRVLEFSEEALHAVLLEQPPLLYRAIRVLMARLREADLQMIADLQRKNVELATAYRELQEAQAGLLEKERLEHELELARELQQSILPHDFPHLAGLQFAARSRPARQVGGDFFDVIPLGKGRVGRGRARLVTRRRRHCLLSLRAQQRSACDQRRRQRGTATHRHWPGSICLQLRLVAGWDPDRLCC